MRKIVVKAAVEPTWKPEECNQFDLIRALNWYTVEKDEKDARKYLVDYLKGSLSKNDIAAANEIATSYFITIGWIARCMSRGCVLPKSSLDNFNRTVAEFKEKIGEIVKQNTVTAVEPANVINLQERIQNKTDEIIGQLEGLIDEFGVKGSAEDMNAYQWMVDNNVKPIHASKIAEYFRNRSKEPLEAASGKDEALKEGYAVYGKKRLINLIKAFSNIVNDAEKLGSNAKAARKPRKKKPVSFEKLIKNIKYLQREDDLKLQSIDPIKIIGASQLWVYNVKTKKLGVYIAADRGGLSVKGSSLLNYKYDESISKTLRKPKDVLKKVSEGGKVVLRKLMSEINSKPQELNGRINKDTILLRVE